MWPLLALAGVETLGNMYSTDVTNKANKEMARQANELNYRMFAEGQDFDKWMWRQSNEYNLPINQRRRVEQAGYSPYLLAQGGNQLGSMTSPIASPQGGGAVTATMQPYDFSAFGRIGDTMQSFAQAKKSIAEAKKTDKETDYVDRLSEAQIKSLVNGGYLSKAQGDKYLQDIAFKDQNWNALSSAVEQQAYETAEKARQLKLDNDLKQEFGRDMMSNEVNKQLEEIKLLCQKGETEKALQKLHESGVLRNHQEGAAAIIQAYAAQRNAATNEAVGNSQINLNNANEAYQRMVNSVYEVFGKPKEATRFLTMLADLEGQSYENISAKVQSYIDEHTKGTKEFGEHMRNILGWLPFMAVPITKLTPNKRPVVGGFQ